MAPESDRDQAKPELRATFDAYWAAAWSAAGAISAISALALIGFSYLPSGALSSALENIAAVALAIGLLQILSSAWLQRKLTREILGEQRAGEARMLVDVGRRFDDLLTSVRRDQRLRPSGVMAVERLGTNWSQFLAGSTQMQILPVDLLAWLREEWVGVLEQTRLRVVSVTVHLPNVKSMDSAGIGTIELRSGHPRDRLITDFDEAIKTMKRDWQDGPLGANCSLEIRTYAQPSAFGLVLTEQSWALILPPAAGPAAGRNIVALFESGADPSFRDWAAAQPQQLDSQFFDEVRP